MAGEDGDDEGDGGCAAAAQLDAPWSAPGAPATDGSTGGGVAAAAGVDVPLIVTSFR